MDIVYILDSEIPENLCNKWFKIANLKAPTNAEVVPKIQPMFNPEIRWDEGINLKCSVELYLLLF